MGEFVLLIMLTICFCCGINLFADANNRMYDDDQKQISDN